MSMGKRALKGHFEQDALTGWRRWYCYTQRAGVVRKAKRQSNRRERRNARKEMNQ